MDTNSNIPVQKKVVNVEILHMDELGYGPQGKHTRREWRKECLENLLAGKVIFEKWRDGWIGHIDDKLDVISFGCKQIYEDETVESLAGFAWGYLPYSLDFVGHEFEAQLNLSNFEFNDDILFQGVIFENTVSFRCTIFNQTVRFKNAVFLGNAYFSEAEFNDDLSFENTFFMGTCLLDRAKFESKAVFDGAIFSSSAYFRKANFSGPVQFKNAEIFGISNFNRVIFNRSANFKNTKFNAEVFFGKTKFISNSEFQYCEFSSLILFENAIFENIGHFEGAKFKVKIPSFRGCKIDTTRLEFSDNSEFPKKDKEEGAIENVSFLKRLSDEHGQTDQSLRFNSIELRLKRLSPTSDIGFKVVTWLYEKLSDYGRSFVRPIFGYTALLVISALFAMIYSTYSDSPSEEQQILCKPLKDQPPPLKLTYGRAVVEYAMFRAGGLMDFTDTGKQNNAVNCRLFEEPIEPPLMRAWGIFKGIASIALLFLAALGLRNKYRIK